MGTPSNLTWRFGAIWYRNWIVYRKTWQVSFLPPLLEPLLYLAAFGIGFKMLIPNVQFHGRDVSYVAFIAPALIAVSIMNSSFFETTYTSFVRMYYQKTFDAIMAAPVSVEEVAAGEIVWGMTRSVLSAAIMLVVLTAVGLIRLPYGLLLLPLAVLGGLGFGALGMIFTSLVPNIDLFTLPTFLFITPMFLFGATFFPLDALPVWAQHLALAFPLTHLVLVAREAGFGSFSGWSTVGSLLYLTVFAAILFPLALKLMRRRLIR